MPHGDQMMVVGKTTSCRMVDLIHRAALPRAGLSIGMRPCQHCRQVIRSVGAVRITSLMVAVLPLKPLLKRNVLLSLALDHQESSRSFSTMQA